MVDIRRFSLECHACKKNVRGFVPKMLKCLY